VLLLAVPRAGPQERPEVLPKIVQHSDPIYPPLASQTRIGGDVRVKITTDGESVIDAEVESGHPLLRKAAEDNLRTWKFAAHTPGTFHVIFRYKFASGGKEVTFLESPAIVQIQAPEPKLIIDYAWLDLGTWKAQLSSAHGKTWQVFSLRFSGPHDEPLDGNARGPKGKTKEIDFGHKEGNFLAFTMNLREPDGRDLKTFFVGTMSKYRIVGTFVDNAGITGEWTAVRLADTPSTK
jgi:Gram-negative bacterial TonB protein C-terminal